MPELAHPIQRSDRPRDAATPPQTIVAESNFLRLPLFALHTRGLRTLEGFECRGKTQRDGQPREFVFRTARNTATQYPGPLSRSAHLGLLSIVSERGLPSLDPITWTWRDLCRRIGISPSGRSVEHLKRAIEATAGLTIFSQDAIYLRPDEQALQSRTTAHLYETVVFVNERLPDGRLADRNYLWLSPWYQANLNALFTAPLDYDLWRSLEKRSSIASRLYEFLLINFYSGTPQLRINYPKLAQFLPVRAELYLSDAQKQMTPAFNLLTEARVLGQVHWQKQPFQVAQLHLDRGERLQGRPTRALTAPAVVANPADDTFAIKEIRHSHEREIVAQFYRLWTGEPAVHPRAKELALAERLLAQHGEPGLRNLLPIVIEQLKRHWPAAKTFVAVEPYLDLAITARDSRQRVVREQQQRLQRQQALAAEQEAVAARQQAFETEWLPIWNRLSHDEQEAIRARRLSQNLSLRHMPNRLLTECLQELSRRSQS